MCQMTNLAVNKNNAKSDSAQPALGEPATPRPCDTDITSPARAGFTNRVD